MKKSGKIVVSDLSVRAFDTHGVWRWSDSNDSYEAIPDPEPLPEDEPTLFIRAEFQAPGGEEFSGYLVGRIQFYAFGLFISGEEILVNLNLPETIKEAVATIRSILESEYFELFPLGYRTDFHLVDGSLLEGVLRP